MVRSIISTLIAAALVVACGFVENHFLKETFNELNEVFNELSVKIDEKDCTEEDALSAQKIWLDKKEKLHVFIPHTEIKEVDLWVSECVNYVSQKDYKEAKAKTVVILELFEQIPKTFLIRTENLL